MLLAGIMRLTEAMAVRAGLFFLALNQVVEPLYPQSYYRSHEFLHEVCCNALQP
jgi:hypothetical protein